MKKILFINFLLLSLFVKSQSPQYLNYQAVARDASGNIITTAIGIKFEILHGSSSGTLVYAETNNITPSSAGIFTTAIGSGAASTVPFNTINWANSPYFLRVSIDPTGGTSYSTVGTSQLLSVPYALYAEKAGNTQTVNITGPNVTGSYPNYTITSSGALTPSTGISISGGTITNTAPDQTVTIGNGTNVSVTGTYPNFIVSSTPTLAINGSSLSISGGNTVLIPTSTTAATPNTSITATGNASVTSSGTNTFNISVPAQTLSLSGSTLSISGGNSVTLPSSPNITLTATGIAAVSPSVSSIFNINVPPPSFTSIGSTTVSGSYPNYTVTSPGALSTSLQINPPHSTTTLSANNYSINIVPTSITGTGVSGSYPNYTVTSAPATTVIAGTNVTVGGTGPTYTVNAVPTLSLAGNNLSISGGNSITLPAPPAQTSVTAGSNITVSGSAPSYTVSGVIPTLALTGSTLTSGPLTNSVNLSSLGVWSSSVGVLYPTTLTNSVAIGSPTASAALDVIGNSTSTIGRFINTTNTGGTVLTADFAGGSSAATYIGIKGNASAIGGTTYGLYGSAGGGGTAYGVYGSMNGAGGYGVYGIAPAGGNGVGVAGVSNAGSTTNAFGVFGSSLNSFGGVFQNSGGTISASLGGQTYSGLFAGGNVGINITNPANRLSVIESTSTGAAIYGSQSTASSSSNAHGIMGLTSNPNALAAGIFGDNLGAGPAVYGYKSTSGGIAGRFEIPSTINNADVVFASTNAGGAAIHAVNGPTVAGSSNVGLWLDAGHLRSSQPTAPSTNTISTSGGGINAVTLALLPGSTDVKGVMNAVITTTGIVNSGNNCVIKVNFNKSYTSPPIVVVTPNTDLFGLTYFVNGITTTSFNLTIRNSTGTNLATPGSLSASFNYIVIE